MSLVVVWISTDTMYRNYAPPVCWYSLLRLMSHANVMSFACVRSSISTLNPHADVSLYDFRYTLYLYRHVCVHVVWIFIGLYACTNTKMYAHILISQVCFIYLCLSLSWCIFLYVRSFIFIFLPTSRLCFVFWHGVPPTTRGRIWNFKINHHLTLAPLPFVSCAWIRKK